MLHVCIRILHDQAIPGKMDFPDRVVAVFAQPDRVPFESQDLGDKMSLPAGGDAEMSAREADH